MRAPGWAPPLGAAAARSPPTNQGREKQLLRGTSTIVSEIWDMLGGQQCIT